MSSVPTRPSILDQTFGPTTTFDHASNVKNWRDGQMALRWCTAGMTETTKQFRQVNGHLHLGALRHALDQHLAETVAPECYNDNVT